MRNVTLIINAEITDTIIPSYIFSVTKSYFSLSLSEEFRNISAYTSKNITQLTT